MSMTAILLQQILAFCLNTGAPQILVNEYSGAMISVPAEIVSQEPVQGWARFNCPKDTE